MTDAREYSDYVTQLPLRAEAIHDPALVEQFPDHMRVIGCLIAEWSHVEYKLVVLLSLAAKVDLRAMQTMLYAVESSRARLSVIRAMFTYLKDDVRRTEALDLLDEAGSLLQQRNKYAHALYGESGSGEIAIVGVKDRTGVDMPLHDITHQFTRMKALSFRVGRMLSRVAGRYEEPPPGFDASPAP